MLIADHHASDKGYAGTSDQPLIIAHLHMVQAKMLFKGFKADFNIPLLGARVCVASVFVGVL
jgi:hypothetical protein